MRLFGGYGEPMEWGGGCWFNILINVFNMYITQLEVGVMLLPHMLPRVTTRYCTRYCWFCMGTIGFSTRYYALLQKCIKKIFKIFLWNSSNALEILWFPYKTNRLVAPLSESTLSSSADKNMFSDGLTAVFSFPKMTHYLSRRRQHCGLLTWGLARSSWWTSECERRWDWKEGNCLVKIWISAHT